MRGVKVTFKDGSTKEYDTIKQAAEDLQVANITINKMSVGCSQSTAKKLGISAVQIKGNMRVKHVRPVGGKAVPVMCTSQDGTVLYARSISEAKEITHFDHYIHFCIDSGRYHWGWKFDSMEQPPDWEDRISFGNTPVPQSIIDNVTKITQWYLSRYRNMSVEDREDITQYTVSHMAADYSNDLHIKSTYPLRVWMYLNTRSYASRKVHKWWKDYSAHVEKPENLEMDRDEWLSTLSGAVEESDEEYIGNLPSKYQRIARLILEGHTGTERTAMLHVPCSERIELERELGMWLLHKNHDFSSSDL